MIVKSDSRRYPHSLNFQFNKIDTFPSGHPLQFAIQLACRCLLKGLTWHQLRDELKNPVLTDLHQLMREIENLSSTIKSRDKCPTCDLRVTNIRKHQKSHKNLQKTKELVTKFREQQRHNNKAYYQILANTHYDMKTFEELFE